MGNPFKKIWQLAGGSAIAGGTVALSPDLVIDIGRFLQKLLLPDFDDPDLAARVLAAFAGILFGAVVGAAKSLASGEVLRAAALCLALGCASQLSAEVRVTCIVEPNARLKNVEQLGCDFKNALAVPVVLSAGDVRDGSLEKIGSPLRHSIASEMIERSEERGFWGTFFQVAKWVGIAASFAQGLDFIKLDDNWRYLIPTLTGGLQAIDGVGRAQHTPLTMPPDYLPEGDFTLGPHETRSYVLLAANKGLASFRMILAGRSLLATAPAAQPSTPTRFRFDAKHSLELLHRRAPDRQVWAFLDGLREDAVTAHNMQRMEADRLMASVR